jgi:hypothetical protein
VDRIEKIMDLVNKIGIVPTDQAANEEPGLLISDN